MHIMLGIKKKNKLLKQVLSLKTSSNSFVQRFCFSFHVSGTATFFLRQLCSKEKKNV